MSKQSNDAGKTLKNPIKFIDSVLREVKESFIPILLGLAAALLVCFFGLSLSSGLEEARSASIQFGAIVMGFVATAMAVFIGFQKQSDAESSGSNSVEAYAIFRQLRFAAGVSVVLVIFGFSELISDVSNARALSAITVVWVAIATIALSSFVRAVNNMVELMNPDSSK